MKKFIKYPSIELLNFEGPVLMAHKRMNLFVVTDQWKEVVAIMLDDELRRFIDGEITIVDSHNKEWNFVNEHSGAKPSPQALEEFLGPKSYKVK